MSFRTQLVSLATTPRRRKVWGAAIATLVLSACSFDLSGNDCSTDSDCPSKHVCIAGWFGGTCAPRCSTNADCDRESFCTTESLVPHCQSGCRDASDCPESEWCNSGSCVAECVDSPRVCDRGRPGSVCVGVSTAANGELEEGFCRPSCQTDTDCKTATFKQCVCGSCSGGPCDAKTCGSNVCRATQDCPTPRCLPK